MNNYLIKYKELKTVVISAKSVEEATKLFANDHKDAYFISINNVDNEIMSEIVISTPGNQEYFSMTISELKKRGYDCEPIWSTESIIFKNTTISKAIEALTDLNVYGKVVHCKQ